MITIKMTNKFLKLNGRKRKKKLNLMLRSLLMGAITHAGMDCGPISRDTKRHFVPFAKAEIHGKNVNLTFFDEE
jgi:hypothetical protein